MTSQTSPPTNIADDESPAVPDDDRTADLPMSMTASMILTNLPKDATQALADTEALDGRKGKRHKPFKLLPSQQCC